MTDPEAARAALDQSHDMDPVHGTVDVAIPIETLWELFRRADLWARWNRCFYWARNRDLVAGQKLIWCFQPIRPQYLYKMPAIADIVVAEQPNQATWHVTALPGFFARHTYTLEAVDEETTRFGSWEKATGWEFRATKKFWIAHFEFVCRESLDGARRLAGIYERTGRLDEGDLAPAH